MDKKATTTAKKTAAKTKTTTAKMAAKAANTASTKATNAKTKAATTKRTTAQSKKSHAGAWIAGGIGAAVVVAMIVLACILIPQMGKPNYGETYKVANELDDKLGEAYDGYNAICYKMLVDAADDDMGMDEYNEEVGECKKVVGEARELTKKLGHSTGITKNDDLKKQFDEYEQLTADGLPEEGKLGIYSRLHEFLLESEKINVDSTEEDVQKVAKPLVESGNRTWADFGQGWSDRTTKLIKAFAAYDKANASDANYRDLYNEYQDALKGLQDFTEDFDIDDAAAGGMDADKINEMLDKYDDLRNAIRKVYEENYDGENEDNCVKASDGDVTCR